MEGPKRACLVIVGWILPIVNFVLFRHTISALTVPETLSPLVFSILSGVAGIFIVCLFFRFAIDTPIEAVVISSVILIMFLLVNPVFLRAEQNKRNALHKKALRTRPLLTTPLKPRKQASGAQ